MTRREKAYNKKLESLIDQALTLQDDAVDRVNKILTATRTELAASLAQTPWEAHYLPQAKDAIERAIRGFEQQYKAEQSEALKTSWSAGVDMVDAPLAAAGIRLVAPEISPSTLGILQGYSADLIGGLSADALKRVNNELTMAVLGQTPQYQVMKTIDELLGIQTRTGISWRAETITRTEMARIHSAAREARMQAVLKGSSDPEVRWGKKWIASGKRHPRWNHRALNGTIVPIDENFPGEIPYPHAPGLSAEESINCGCSHVLVPLDWGELPKQGEPVEYQERAA